MSGTVSLSLVNFRKPSLNDTGNSSQFLIGLLTSATIGRIDGGSSCSCHSSGFGTVRSRGSACWPEKAGGGGAVQAAGAGAAERWRASVSGLCPAAGRAALGGERVGGRKGVRQLFHPYGEPSAPPEEIGPRAVPGGATNVLGQLLALVSARRIGARGVPA